MVHPLVNPHQTIRTAVCCMAVVLFLSGCLWNKEMSRNTRAFVGMMYVTGNEPFTMLALQADDGGVIKIRNDSSAIYRSLWKLQGQRLRIYVRSAKAPSDTSSIFVERFELLKMP
jgi:hypothetical protein